MGSPLDVRSDYVYPPYYTRQKLAWEDKEACWFMTFPARRYAYAGIEFKRIVDLQERRDFTRLTFRLRPARLAPFLSVALVDRPSNQTIRAMTDFWIKDAGDFSGEGWAEVEIALTHFPEDALPLADESTGSVQPPSNLSRSFDWSSVSGIRFVSGGGRIPSEQIMVKNLYFQR